MNFNLSTSPSDPLSVQYIIMFIRTVSYAWIVVSSRGLEWDGQDKDQFRVNVKLATVDDDIFSQHSPADPLGTLRWKLILAFFIGT